MALARPGEVASDPDEGEGNGADRRDLLPGEALRGYATLELASTSGGKLTAELVGEGDGQLQIWTESAETFHAGDGPRSVAGPITPTFGRSLELRYTTGSRSNAAVILTMTN